MQSIDYSGLDELDKRFERVLKELPAERKRMHEEVAAALKPLVDAEIGASGLLNNGGRVKGWQQTQVGSSGGYAAVRAVGQAEGFSPGRNSPGAITNYLEVGHKVRGPTGKAKRKRKSRAKQSNVKAYAFYQRSRAQAQKVAHDAAERYVDSIAEKLGD